MRIVRCSLAIIAVVLLAAGQPQADRLQKWLKKFPEADANGDGVLTLEEVRAYRAKMTRQGKAQPGRSGPPLPMR